MARGPRKTPTNLVLLRGNPSKRPLPKGEPRPARLKVARMPQGDPDGASGEIFGPKLSQMDGINIKRARVAAGVTQDVLAEGVGLSVAQISRFESGNRMPRVDELERIAERLRVPITVLIYGDGSDRRDSATATAIAGVDLVFVERLAVATLIELGHPEAQSRDLVGAWLKAARTSQGEPDDAKVRFLAHHLVLLFSD